MSIFSSQHFDAGPGRTLGQQYTIPSRGCVRIYLYPASPTRPTLSHNMHNNFARTIQIWFGRCHQGQRDKIKSWIYILALVLWVRPWHNVIHYAPWLCFRFAYDCFFCSSGLILRLHPTNERRRYKVRLPSLAERKLRISSDPHLSPFPLACSTCYTLFTAVL